MAIGLLLALSLSLVFPVNIVSAEAAESEVQRHEEKIYSNATIDDDFDENSMLVILSEQATLSFKKYTKDDFPEFNCYEVVDLTWQTAELVKKQLAVEKTGNWGEIQAWKDNAMLVNVQSFRRILSLRINESSRADALEGRSSLESRNNKESVLRAVRSIEGRSDIIYAGPNFIHESARTPNDPEYTNGNQWAINHIGLPNAWDITTGSADVRVGIIDTGIDGNHEDLRNRVNNNLHRDFRNATTVNLPTPFDTGNHGTHVAGIIGAEANNNPNPLGITGANWNVNLVCLIISENGSWFVDNAILAVDHATANNIQILNYSGRVRDRNNVININDPVFEQSIRDYPGLFVAAAGNSGTNNDTNPQFPANYARTLNNVISVGATDDDDQRANFSQYGVNTVSIYAPGVGIRSTVPGTGTYQNMNGTSMASPFVAGVAALIRSIQPNITAAQLRDSILNNADAITIDTPIGNQNVLRLNAFKAVSSVAFNLTNIGTNNIRIDSPRFTINGSLMLPDTINGRNVTTIGASAFANQSSCTEILLPSSITTIGNSAFANCTGLQSIVIPSTVTTMGTNVFSGCSDITIYTVAKSKPSGWQNSWAANRPVFWGKWKQYQSDVITGFGYSGSTYYWNGALRLTVPDEINTFNNSSGRLVIDGANSTLTFNVRTVSSSNAFTSMSGYVRVNHTPPGGTASQVLNCNLSVSILNNVTLSPSSFTLNTSNLANGVHTLTLTSYVKRGSWNSSSTKTYTFEINKKKENYDNLMEFGYNGSTFYWNGAVDMTVTNRSVYSHNSSTNTGTITGATDLSFSIRTISSSNSISVISGDITFKSQTHEYFVTDSSGSAAQDRISKSRTQHHKGHSGHLRAYDTIKQAEQLRISWERY